MKTLLVGIVISTCIASFGPAARAQHQSAVPYGERRHPSRRSVDASRDLTPGELDALDALDALPALTDAANGVATLGSLGSLGSFGGPGRRAGDGHEGGLERRLPPRSWNAQDPADSLWRAARRALSDEDYRHAADLFGRIVERYPESDYAGDALYWRAWALYHVGRPRDLEDAIGAIEQQSQEYPKANTHADARELRARILAAQARSGDSRAAQQTAVMAEQLQHEKGCPSEDDDMRIAALQGLMQMDGESALPILRQVLARRGACTERLRKQAVFIVSQQQSDDATTLLLDVARNDPSRDVRADAIQWLGQSRSSRAQAALDSILSSGRDEELVDKAIFALSQIHDDRAAESLRRFAQDETRPAAARAQAVFWLGQTSHGSEDLRFLRDLFHKTESGRSAATSSRQSRRCAAPRAGGGCSISRWTRVPRWTRARTRSSGQDRAGAM